MDDEIWLTTVKNNPTLPCEKKELRGPIWVFFRGRAKSDGPTGFPQILVSGGLREEGTWERVAKEGAEKREKSGGTEKDCSRPKATRSWRTKRREGPGEIYL